MCLPFARHEKEKASGSPDRALSGRGVFDKRPCTPLPSLRKLTQHDAARTENAPKAENESDIGMLFGV